MPVTIPEKQFIEFKLSKVRTLYVGTSTFMPPVRMIFQSTQFASAEGLTTENTNAANTKAKLVPDFDLEKIHRLPLRDERPRVPKKPAGMSDGYWQTLADAAWKRAAENKVHNDRIRDVLYSHARIGNLTIVTDPFDGNEDVIEGLDELAEAVRAEQADQKLADEAAALVAAQTRHDADEQASAAVATVTEKPTKKTK